MKERKRVGGEIVAVPVILAALDELRSVREWERYLAAKGEGLKAKIMAAMGRYDTLVDSSGAPLATWKYSQQTQKFDAESFRKAHADLYSQFTISGEPSRRFLLKQNVDRPEEMG